LTTGWQRCGCDGDTANVSCAAVATSNGNNTAAVVATCCCGDNVTAAVATTQLQHIAAAQAKVVVQW
jgi:hypothetical protein